MSKIEERVVGGVVFAPEKDRRDLSSFPISLVGVTVGRDQLEKPLESLLMDEGVRRVRMAFLSFLSRRLSLCRSSPFRSSPLPNPNPPVTAAAAVIAMAVAAALVTAVAGLPLLTGVTCCVGEVMGLVVVVGGD